MHGPCPVGPSSTLGRSQPFFPDTYCCPRIHWSCCSHHVPDPGHQYIHCHTTGPLARPMIDHMRSRFLPPSAAREIEDKQTGSSTAQSGQHTQATQLRPVIPSPAGKLCPCVPSLVPASSGSRHVPPCRLLWPEPPLACQFLLALSCGLGPPKQGWIESIVLPWVPNC